MALQDASTAAASTRAAAPAPKAKPVRRLPVQKDWPVWAIIAVQIGILAGALAAWEVGARIGLVDGLAAQHLGGDQVEAPRSRLEADRSLHPHTRIMAKRTGRRPRT